MRRDFLQGVLADGREIIFKRLFFNNKHRAIDFNNEFFNTEKSFL
ncbi:hypothetical protein RDI58_022548 [Solanum bulbocastanum]|uniref:Uncharacterized protein n=1 Tax=Solanum bulbocastanum TaxID=147425 RepID=A0AAN8T5Y5_SOLBU